MAAYMAAYMAGEAETTVHLRPRRRTWDRNRELREAVDLTVEALTALFGMRAPDAARSLGIGVNTFKKICRRLGIERWPDSRIGRTRGRVRVVAPTAPACAETVTAPWSSDEGETASAGSWEDETDLWFLACDSVAWIIFLRL